MRKRAEQSQKRSELHRACTRNQRHIKELREARPVSYFDFDGHSPNGRGSNGQLGCIVQYALRTKLASGSVEFILHEEVTRS